MTGCWSAAASIDAMWNQQREAEAVAEDALRGIRRRNREGRDG